MSPQKLFNQNFILVLLGQMISLFGNAILRFALPLYLLRETDSSTIFGAVMAISFVPIIIFSLIGGLLADRINKRNIMVMLDFLTALSMLLFYIAIDSLPIIPLVTITLLFLSAIGGAYQPVVQASIPVLVPSMELVKANALINQVSALANLIGPILGGFLFGIWGITPIVLLSIFCFIFSGIMEIFICIPYKKTASHSHMIPILQNDFKEAYTFIKKEKPIFFSLAFIIAAFNLVLTSILIVGIPILIIQTLNLSDESLGMTQGVLALGGLFGGICAGIFHEQLRISTAHRLLFTCALSVFVMGISLLFPTVISYTTITCMCFIAMTVSTLFSIQLFSLMQRETPPHLIGKIMASIIAVALCSQPIGQGIYGVLFKQFYNQPWQLLIIASLLGVSVSLYSKKVFQRL